MAIYTCTQASMPPPCSKTHLMPALRYVLMHIHVHMGSHRQSRYWFSFICEDRSPKVLMIGQCVSRASGRDYSQIGVPRRRAVGRTTADLCPGLAELQPQWGWIVNQESEVDGPRH